MPQTSCPICQQSFEYVEDDFGLFALPPDSCGKEACVKQCELERKAAFEQFAKQEKLARSEELMKAATDAAANTIPWKGTLQSGDVTVTWTSTDAEGARALGDAAIELYREQQLSALIFLGESLVPIKHYMIAKMKDDAVIRKVSGSFSGISVAEIEDEDLKPWLDYVDNKLRRALLTEKIRVGFIDYSASGKTFTSLAKVLAKAQLSTHPMLGDCTFVFIPVVKRASELPAMLQSQIAKDCAQLKFEVAPLHPKLQMEQFVCDTLLAEEKMKKILGRRSRRLHLELWAKEAELRKTGMSVNMPAQWRKEISLRLLDDSSSADRDFLQQPTFEATKAAV